MLLRLTSALLFAQTAVAFAEADGTTRGAHVGSEATSTTDASTQSASFVLGGHASTFWIARDMQVTRNGVSRREDTGWEVGTRGELRLSAGALPTLSATGTAYIHTTSLEPVAEELPDVANIASIDAAHEAAPSLLAPRDLLRGTYNRYGVTLGDVDEQIWLGDNIGGGATVAYVHQDGVARMEGYGTATFWRWCRRRDGEVRGCVGAWTQEIRSATLVVDGEEGSKSSTLGFWPLPITHVRLGAIRLDARAGLLSANHRVRPAMQRNDEHRLHTAGYDVKATVEHDAGTLVVSAARSLRPSMLFDFMLDDRIELLATRRARKLDITARAAVAHTQLFTPMLEAMGSARTGGADVTLARRLDTWTVTVAAGAARTFYPSPAAGTLTPTFAATGTVGLSHAFGDRRAQ